MWWRPPTAAALRGFCAGEALDDGRQHHGFDARAVVLDHDSSAVARARRRVVALVPGGVCPGVGEQLGQDLVQAGGVTGYRQGRRVSASVVPGSS